MAKCVYEYVKLVELAMVFILGSVEDERLFSTMACVKNKLINMLTNHLECSVKLYAQKFYTL